MNTNYRSTKTISGSGAAHGAGLMLFGRRGPLLNAEDEGGSGAAPAQPAPVETPATTPAQGGNVKTFTQEEVNRLVGNAREEGRKSALKTAAPVTPPPAAPSSGGDNEDKVTKKALQAQLEEVNLRLAFDKRAAKTTLDDEAAEDLFQLFKAQKPTDVAAWFESKSKSFGFKPLSQGAAPVPAASTQPATPTATPAPEAPKPPAAAPAAPATSHALPTVNGAIDLWNLTHAQLNALGPQGVRAELEKLAKIGEQMQGRPQRPQLPNRQR